MMFSEKTQVPVPWPGWSAPRKTEVNDAIGSGCYFINLANRHPRRRSCRYKDKNSLNPWRQGSESQGPDEKVCRSKTPPRPASKRLVIALSHAPQDGLIIHSASIESFRSATAGFLIECSGKDFYHDGMTASAANIPKNHSRDSYLPTKKGKRIQHPA